MFRACMIALGVALTVVACGESTQPAASATATPPSSASPSLEVNPGGDIPDTQAYVTFTAPSGAYTVRVPEGWARTDQAGSVTFTSHFDSVTLASLAAANQPTTASVTATELPALQHQSNNVVIGHVTSAMRTSGEAILVTYQADSPPDPVTGHIARLDVERYDFWRAGTEVVITLSAPTGADNVDPWRTITDSFAWH